eukprot:CAMPEP_0196134476 /NCGR_PEP_ID=MMETSP0910-20130528/3370_1 /TAXON_ID=49265 /ORGANISM="Thalassiosira rotula, Strain GSO102" /LENGTH=803 /DNA_ID=CAMNT_0041394411 /DNA_START=118 /DNA_END=2529 /DNA_ORIENTATION=+
MKVFAISLTSLLATAVRGAEEGDTPTESIVHGKDCAPCPDTDGECVIKTMVNLHAGETGYYMFDGCEGVNPTLHLTMSRTYKFDQSDISNWYHLLGFAYEADGAHVPVDELEPGIAPGDSDCAETNTCPAPMYFMDGKYQGVFSNIEAIAPLAGDEDFGLDAVEPLFFHPLGDWQGYGDMATYLNFDKDFDKDFFYFCHIHAGMSGRVKLVDADGNKMSEEDTPELPYKYAQVGQFDLDCGTFNTTGFKLTTEESGPGDKCPGFFVCADEEVEKSGYATCVEAMNCHMIQSMTTYAAGTSELFCHQMIPHHQNAVNMAKALLKAHPDTLTCDTSGPVEEGSVQPWACDLIPVLYDIVNVQNSQIIDMRDALDQLGAEEYNNCDMRFGELTAPAAPAMRRRTEEGDVNYPYVSGADCEPCAGTEGECTVVMKVNHHAGELGYYMVDGCEGVNPTLHLTKDRVYKFDQTEKSNWYHLIGLAYFPDGAHEGVDELEPGIAPGDSTCAEDLTCPAPMYFMDGKYQGVFSNIESIAPLAGDEDFGLDAVEPLFFHPLGDWQGYGAMETYLKFDQDYDDDIFYFCHLHAGMTGRIKIKDAAGNMMSAENKPDIGYEYDIIDGHDGGCGTYGLNPFTLPNDQCPESFVCGPLDAGVQDFATCINSMDCSMLDGMTTNYGGDGITNPAWNDAILFIRQMIPHHQNAVNMAKALIKTGAVACGQTGPTEEGAAQSTACLLEPIALGIIVTQNKQIQVMKGVLEALGVTEMTSDCDFELSDAAASNSTSSASDVAVNSAKLVASFAAGAFAMF